MTAEEKEPWERVWDALDEASIIHAAQEHSRQGVAHGIICEFLMERGVPEPSRRAGQLLARLEGCGITLSSADKEPF